MKLENRMEHMYQEGKASWRMKEGMIYLFVFIVVIIENERFQLV